MHSGGPDISSGFGPAGGSLSAQLNPGDPLVINSVTYSYERVLSKSTGEAEIFLLRQDRQLVVLKLYYQSFKPKQEILAPLKQLQHADIINVIDYGYFYDRFFEIMEYAQGGTLQQYLPVRDVQRLRSIVSEVANALEFCHARDVIHRDIKPENIYCRNTDGTDIVIGDFGISSALDAGISRRLTAQNLTAGYAAPEMYGFGGKVYVGREVDYYALGITLIHLWQGHSPFGSDMTPHAIGNMTTAGLISVPGDLPDEWQKLIRGLITIDYSKRWGHSEVQRWLNGEDVPVHFHTKEISYPPFQFDTYLTAKSPTALAALLKAQPEVGKKLLYRGRISAWVNVFDHALADRLDLIVEDQFPKDQVAGLQKTIFLLDPDEPCSIDGKHCRTSQELAAALEDGFSAYKDALTQPSHPFYLYLEAHEDQKEADAFRALYRTFSPKSALNMVILELAGKNSVTIAGQTFSSAAAVLQARGQMAVVNWLKDPESKLSLWMDSVASPTIKAQLQDWRALQTCDAATLAFVSDSSDGVPKLELSEKSFSFTDLKTRTQTAATLEIRNKGGGSLSGTLTSSKPWLKLGQGRIDPAHKVQSLSFIVDTNGFAYDTKDSAVIEVKSNVGVESIGVSIAIERGVQAVARYRTLMTVAAGAIGGGVGLAISAASSMANIEQPSSLAGIVAGGGLAIHVGKKYGKQPLIAGFAALACAYAFLAALQDKSPLIFSVASWALLFMAAAYAFAPSIFSRVQTAKSRVTVPAGILAGATALCVVTIVADLTLQFSKKVSQASASDIWRRHTAAPGRSANVTGPAAGAPTWVQQLASHEIVDGAGLAGISIGDSLKETVAVLGKGDKVEFIKNDSKMYAVVRYEWKEISLSIGFSHSQRILNMGLHDSGFNSSGLIQKTAKGVTIGSRTDDLLKYYGAPVKTYSKYGCAKEEAELLVYSGVSFWNCLRSRRIQGIDIPGLYGVR